MALSGKVGGPACCVWAVFSLRGEEEAGRDCRKSGIPGIVFLDLLEEALSHIFLPRQSRSVDTNPYADLLALATPQVSKRIAPIILEAPYASSTIKRPTPNSRPHRKPELIKNNTRGAKEEIFDHLPPLRSLDNRGVG